MGCYSVESRLIGETLQVRLFAEHMDLYYAQKCVDTLPRLRGENRHLINYRHMIDQLERKPGCNVSPSGGESWRVCPMNLQFLVQNIP